MINVNNQRSLLVAVGEKLSKRMTVYAIGGTAMMFHGFKDVTLDIDLVFTSDDDRIIFRTTLKELDYSPYKFVAKVYGVKDNVPWMMSRGVNNNERFDLFTREVINFHFSEGMIARSSETHEFGKNLVLKIANPHDIILMKCATDRAKDKEDAKTILSTYPIDWNIIISEAIKQKALGRDRTLFDLAGFVMDLTKMSIKIPIFIVKRLESLLHVDMKSNIEDAQKTLGDFK